MSDELVQFVDRQLRVTGLRIAEAVARAEQPLSVEAQRHWLAECAEREASVDRMAHADFWPLVRMQLTPTQTRVMWTLIAQELDPAARMQLRELATEDDSDVNQDVLRRIVYGHRPTRRVFAISHNEVRSCTPASSNRSTTTTFQPTARRIGSRGACSP